MFKGEKIFQFIYGVLALACVVVIIMAIVGVILYFDRVGLYTNEEGVLLRTADVIQANMSKVTGNADYKLSNSAVYIELTAKIQVKPTLLALPLFAAVEGNPSSNQNWYTIECQAIKGY